MLNTSNSAEDALADSIPESLQHLRWPSSNNASYLLRQWAMARSVVRVNRYQRLREELVLSDPLAPNETDESLYFGATTLLEDVNRGRLTRPSEYTSVLAVNCWRIF